MRERLDEPAGWIARGVIRPLAEPVSPVGGLVALRGTLAPEGAILKRAAATPALFEVEGRAVVFEGLEDLGARIDDPDLDVRPEDVLVPRTPGRTRRGCRRRATCRSRAGWRAPGSGTWSASPTRG